MINKMNLKLTFLISLIWYIFICLWVKKPSWERTPRPTVAQDVTNRVFLHAEEYTIARVYSRYYQLAPCTPVVYALRISCWASNWCSIHNYLNTRPGMNVDCDWPMKCIDTCSWSCKNPIIITVSVSVVDVDRVKNKCCVTRKVMAMVRFKVGVKSNSALCEICAWRNWNKQIWSWNCL